MTTTIYPGLQTQRDERPELRLKRFFTVPGVSAYDRIEWETGDASSGIGGLGGASARAGYSNGTGLPGTFFEVTGSAVNGALLDDHPTTGLAVNSNVGVPGRFLFQVRSGVPTSL